MLNGWRSWAGSCAKGRSLAVSTENLDSDEPMDFWTMVLDVR